MQKEKTDVVPNVTKEDIARGLEQAGLKNGDVAFVHSSLSSFGRVEGGADAVIDALLETVGTQGTVVMPTFSWENQHQRIFDVAHTPSEVGAISEAFRKRKDAIRSIHVCHSIAAIGPRAKDVMGDGQTAFGPGSSFDQLYHLDCAYLMLGVGFSSCSALHMVEEFMQVPYRYYRDFSGFTVLLPDGTKIPAQSTEFIRKEGYGNDLARMGSVFEKAGILQTSVVGNAKIIATKIKKIFDLTQEYMKMDIAFLLNATSRKLLRSEEAGYDN